MAPPLVISVCFQKGGVGKTTITRELSAACALRGYQVLAVDCDPQGSLTSSWLDPDIYEGTLAHVLLEPNQQIRQKRIEPMSLSEVIVESPVKNLDLVPSDIRLSPFEMSAEYLTHRLANQIEEHAVNYDFVFLDCPPNLGKLLTAALYASTHALVPCAADVISLHGLPDLNFHIQRVKKEVNRRLQQIGVIMTRYSSKRRLSSEARAAVENEVGVQNVFDANLHELVKIAEAPSYRLPVLLSAPDTQASEQIETLTDELLDRLKVTRNKIQAVK
jgi:chromosome partitioning protein